MNPLLLLVSILCTLVSSVFAIAQPSFEDMERLWKNGKYLEAVDGLRTYRKTNPAGRNALVDYYLATGFCRLPGQERLGANFFEWIIISYNTRLDNAVMDVILQEQKKCPAEDSPPLIKAPQALTTIRSGITDFDFESNKFFGKGAQPSTLKLDARLRPIDPALFHDRLFRAESSALASTDLEKSLESDFDSLNQRFEVRKTDHFLLVGTEKTNRLLEEAGDLLESTLAFFQREFGMAEPSYLITVYLISGEEQIVEIADVLHGIDAGETPLLGYSFQKDQSIVSLVSVGLFSRNLGSVNRELFYLMSRQFFGDIPPWVIEGIASLYEVSRIEDGRVIGLDNWRKNVLKEFWNYRPSLEQLTSLTWANLQSDSFPSPNEYIWFATAQYFFKYLQDQHGKVGAVYQALRALSPETIQVDIHTDTLRLLEEQLGMPLADLEAAFSTWLADEISP